MNMKIWCEVDSTASLHQLSLVLPKISLVFGLYMK